MDSLLILMNGKKENAPKLRTLIDIELDEVSLIDNTGIPAYIGTSVETRNGKETLKELRELDGNKVFTEDFSVEPNLETNLNDYKNIR